MSLSVRAAWRIVTPSEHSRRRILARWPKAQVSVIPWPPYSEPGMLAIGKEPYSEGPKTLTVLVVSSVDKHKRLPMAIDAVAAARKATGQDFQLVLVTRPGNDGKAFSAKLASADPRGAWTSTVSGIDDDSLSQLYSNAFCVLVASVDEGFCLPALEASASGVPVVHTNRGALPEVIPRDLSTEPELDSDRAVLTAQIVKLLDVGTWIRFRDDDRHHAERFSREKFNENWSALLREAVKA